MALNAQQSAPTNRIGNTRLHQQHVRLKSDILIFVLNRKRLKSVKWINEVEKLFFLKMEINKEKIRSFCSITMIKARMLHRLVQKNLRYLR